MKRVLALLRKPKTDPDRACRCFMRLTRQKLITKDADNVRRRPVIHRSRGRCARQAQESLWRERNARTRRIVS
jgi:hypothetical protein